MNRALLVVACLVLAPELAQACAVCGAGADEDQSRVAYLITTAALSLLPLVLFGTFLLWLRAKSRRRNAAQAPPKPH